MFNNLISTNKNIRNEDDLGRYRQKQKNAETRQAIIDTAVKIALEEGFDALSIRKITDELGYSSGIIYHYFNDKQEIIDIIRNETSLQLFESVTKLILPENSFAVNTGRVLRYISEVSRHQPDTIKLILMGKYSKDFTDTTNKWIDMIKQCVELGISSGELRNIDSNVVSYMLLNTFLVAQFMINKQDITDDGINKIFDSELDIILNGLLNK